MGLIYAIGNGLWHLLDWVRSVLFGIGRGLLRLPPMLIKEPPTFQQYIRASMTLGLTGAYLIGFVWVVEEMVNDPESLDSIEGFIALLAVVGVLVKEIVEKLYEKD